MKLYQRQFKESEYLPVQRGDLILNGVNFEYAKILCDGMMIGEMKKGGIIYSPGEVRLWQIFSHDKTSIELFLNPSKTIVLKSEGEPDIKLIYNKRFEIEIEDLLLKAY